MIITIANLKGGAGKSTLSCHLASIISRQASCLLIDADPQQSLLGWVASRLTDSPFPVKPLISDKIHQDVSTLSSGFSHVIIDTPPRTSSIVRSAILAADLVVIPAQPSIFDLYSAQSTLDLVSEAQQFKPGIKTVLLFNRVVNRSRIYLEATSQVRDNLKVYVLQNYLGSRVAFSESASGYTVDEFEPGGLAALEVEHVSKELLVFLGLDRW